MPSRYEQEQRRRAAAHIKTLEKKEAPNKFSRRKLFWGTGGAVALGLVGAGSYELIAQDDSNDYPKGEEFEDVLIDYPEMKDAEVRQSGTIQTSQKTINYYNFTDSEIDPEQTKQVYELAERVKGEDLLMKFRVNDLDVPIEVRNPVHLLRLFIVDNEAPLPEGVGDLLYDYSAFTGNLKSDDSNAFTIIRVHKKDEIPRDSAGYYLTSKDYNNASIFTEACQGSSLASVSPDPANNIQETFCNSFGKALESASQGVPFSQYREQVKARRTYIEGSQVPLAPLSEGFYTNIPQLSPFK